MKEIDKEKFEEVARQCPTAKDVCIMFKVDAKTMDKFCKKTYDGKTTGEAIRMFSLETVKILKNKLIERALAGSDACLFFALKNWGNMTDNPKANEDELSEQEIEKHNKSILKVQYNINNPPKERKIEDFEQ